MPINLWYESNYTCRISNINIFCSHSLILPLSQLIFCSFRRIFIANEIHIQYNCHIFANLSIQCTNKRTQTACLRYIWIYLISVRLLLVCVLVCMQRLYSMSISTNRTGDSNDRHSFYTQHKIIWITWIKTIFLVWCACATETRKRERENSHTDDNTR